MTVIWKSKRRRRRIQHYQSHPHQQGAGPLAYRYLFLLLPTWLAVVYYLSLHWFTSGSYYEQFLLSIAVGTPDQFLSSIPLQSTETKEPIEGPSSSPLQANASTGCYDWRLGTEELPRQQQGNSHSALSSRPTTISSSSSTNRRGIVVTLVLGETARDFLCRFFPSQLTNLILPQQWDVLLVVGTTFKDRRPHQKSYQIKEHLISCLNLTKQEEYSSSREWHNLDGSTLLTEEYRVQLPSISYNNNKNDTGKDDEKMITLKEPRIYLAETELALPHYIQANQSLLKVPMQPKQCQAPIPYVMGTKWYVHEMLHLAILQEYRYFIKLDTDVVFIKPLVSLDLIHDMTLRGAIFGHTGQEPDHIVAPCGNGITTAFRDFMQQQEQHLYKSKGKLPCSHPQHPKLIKDADLYYTNFILGRTDFFQSSRVLQFSRFLAEYPHGFFRYRWTDQIFWHFAMGLAIAPDFEHAVVDYAEFRCAPHRNCWLSVHHYNHDRCNNGGSFFHTKAKTTPSDNPQWTWKEYLDINDFTGHNNNSATTIIRPELKTEPYQVQYVDQCQKMPFL